eukprot:3625665-Amphidinium_carterae.1
MHCLSLRNSVFIKVSGSYAPIAQSLFALESGLVVLAGVGVSWWLSMAVILPSRDSLIKRTLQSHSWSCSSVSFVGAREQPTSCIPCHSAFNAIYQDKSSRVSQIVVRLHSPIQLKQQIVSCATASRSCQEPSTCQVVLALQLREHPVDPLAQAQE